MSLFGKILAVLNLIGAIALCALAGLAYSKRSAWAEAAFRHELGVTGLPLDGKELDKQHRPRSARIDQKLLGDLFAQAGGSPVATQVDEVNRLKADLDGTIAAAAQGKDGLQASAAKAYALARILRGLVSTATERAQVQAALTHFKDEKSLEALKGRMRQAVLEAIKVPPPELRQIKPAPSVPEAFLFAFRSEPGAPAAALAGDVAAGLAAAARDKDKGPNFDAVFQAAVDKQAAELDKKYNEYFAGALGTTGSEGAAAGKSPQELQKAAIAQLLVGLAPYFAEQALSSAERPPADEELMKGLTPGTAAYDLKVPDTETFERWLRRALVISGPRALTDAVLSRAAALREMAGDVRVDAQREQSQFVSDNATLVRQLRVLSDLLHDESKRLGDTTALEGAQATLVKAQLDAVAKRRGELADSLRATNALYAELKAKSEALLKNRQAIQEVIRRTEKGEEHIRYLEDLARSAASRDPK